MNSSGTMLVLHFIFNVKSGSKFKTSSKTLDYNTLLYPFFAKVFPFQHSLKQLIVDSERLIVLKSFCACFLCFYSDQKVASPTDLHSLNQIDPFPQCLDTESCRAESTKQLILLCSDFDSSWGWNGMCIWSTREYAEGRPHCYFNVLFLISS